MGKGSKKAVALEAVIPHRGLNLTRSSEILASEEGSDGLNVSFKDGVMSRRAGTKIVSQLFNRIHKIIRYPRRDGTEHLIIITNSEAINYSDGSRSIWVGTLVDDCETQKWTDAGGPGVTIASDASIFDVGTKSTKFTLTGGVGTSNEVLAYYDFGTEDWSSFDALIYSFRCSKATDVADNTITMIALQGGGFGAGAAVAWVASAPSGSLAAATWQKSPMPTLGWVDTRNDIQGVQIGIEGTDNTTTDWVSGDIIWIDNLWAVAKLGSLSAGDHVGHSVFNGKLYVTNDSDGIYSLDDPDADRFVAETIPNAIFQGRYLVNFGSRLVAGYLVESGVTFASKIRWSAIEDATNWTSLGAGYQFLGSAGRETEGESSQITGLIKLDESILLVLKKYSLVALRYVGLTPAGDNPFQVFFDTTNTVPSAGCPYGSSAAQNPEGTVFFLGWDNVYQITSVREAINIEPIGDAVRGEILDGIRNSANKLDPTKLSLIVGAIYPTRHEYHLTLPTASPTYGRITYVYNWVERTWTKYEALYDATANNHGITAGGVFNSGAVAQGLQWNLVGTSNGYVLRFDDTEVSDIEDDTNGAFSASYETKNFFADLKRPAISQYSRLAKWDFWARRGLAGQGSDQTITAAISVDGGDNFTDSQTITLDSDSWKRYTYWIDKAVQNVILKFSSTGTNDWEIKMHQPWVLERSDK